MMRSVVHSRLEITGSYCRVRKEDRARRREQAKNGYVVFTKMYYLYKRH